MSVVRLSIIIVTYNSERTITECLDSLIKLNSSFTEILVFDNGSSDSTPNILKNYSSKISLELSDKNFGFSTACNWCVERAEKASHLAFINPDTYVTPDVVQRAIDSFADNSVGLVGFVCTNSNGLIDKNFRRYPSVMSEILTISDKVTGNFVYKKNFNLNKHYLDGSCLFIKKSDFMEAGMFKDFFLYGEDVILCYNLNKRNVKFLYHGDLSYLHLRGHSSSSSSSERSWSMLPNIVYGELYYLCNRSFLYRFSYLMLRFFVSSTLIIFFLLSLKRQNSKRTFFIQRFYHIIKYSIPFLIQGKKFHKSEFHVLSTRLSQDTSVQNTPSL
jgi:N-acetylglucosaminyl-diphospho-decaprenol L-rhamnosyltransferase